MTWLLALLACGPASEDVARAIASENPVQREEGAKIARNVGGDAVETALLDVLDDPSEAVRLNAVESLATLEATIATESLVGRLRDDPSPAVKRAAADALGRLGATSAAPALVAYVQAFSDDDRDQLAGLWALGAVGALGLAQQDRAAVMAVLVARREATRDRYVRYNTSAALRTLR